MIKAVVFDLDDTLISEGKYIESGYQYISTILGYRYKKDPLSIYQLLSQLFMTDSKNVFNRLLESLDISYTSNDIIELVSEYRNHLPTISFFPDVIPCLQKLKENGIKTGIITDGYSNGQRQKLQALDAYAFFDEIIVTDELGRDYWKPHPRAFELMKKKLNVQYDQMVYVGDNPEKDFYISSIYPTKTIRIHRGGVYQEREYLKGIKEHHSIRSLDELSTLVL